jgi:glutamyl/glutaminyl-tRNA synthetase
MTAGAVPPHLPHGGRTRLAPTPSGFLHAGNAINFLLTYQLARATGSAILLRIDDLDAERVRPAYLEDIFRSLEWLGITWDEGPSGPEEHQRDWSQRKRIPRYQELADALRAKGLVYGCTCSRQQVRERSTDGRYPGTCRDLGLPLDAPDTAWRLRLAPTGPIGIPLLTGGIQPVDLMAHMGDPVVRQRAGDGPGVPAYQLASLADDVDRRITFVVRGEDLLPSTACQLHIAELLGLNEFEVVRFLHHPLLLDPEGRKLSKSEGASSLQAMQAAGHSADGLRRQVDELSERLLTP